MFQERILIQCWPPHQCWDRGRGEREPGGLARDARAADLDTPAPWEAEPPLEGRRLLRADAAGCVAGGAGMHKLEES